MQIMQTKSADLIGAGAIQSLLYILVYQAFEHMLTKIRIWKRSYST